MSGRDFVGDTYRIADIANWSWAISHEWSGIDITGLVHLQAWLERKNLTKAGQKIIVQ